MQDDQGEKQTLNAGQQQNHIDEWIGHSEHKERARTSLSALQ